ncbi:MAG: polysaccharide deacetylase family protein [Pseudomonadota bacterium]
MLSPPPREATAGFASDFGQRVLLTVDTEEEFDWGGPFRSEGYGLEHVGEIARFQSFCEGLGASPVYLVDWPVATDTKAIEIIGDAVKRGAAEVGVQLHPWVNPPFDEEVTAFNSYAGNLPRELEAAKFIALRDQIEKAFGTSPQIYRAGRYGLGQHTAELLKQAGITVDTSVRSLFDYSAQHGPDYSKHPLRPYWVDEERSLLELPVTSTYWGVLRQLGIPIQRLQRHLPTFYSAFSKFGLLERIAFTPEGVTADEAIRGIDIALDTGLPLLVLSFHSPSLAPGHTPYVRSAADVENLYDWFTEIYTYLGKRGARNTSVAEIIAAAQT